MIPRAILPLLLLCALSACGGGQPRVLTSGAPGSPAYAPPGPPADPWGPYIIEASGRFDVPQPWIRIVMRQESGGHQYLHGRLITSDAGAVGLMQLEPATYGELSARYGLGPDPYLPRDNILAGTGYIRELYDRYGAPAFLAAYDAGPHRLEAYLAGRSRLPNETVNYLASTAPYLGHDKPLSGPLVVFASAAAARGRGPVPQNYEQMPNGCWQDRNAAYDPQARCRRTHNPVMVARAAPRVAPVEVAEAPLPAPSAPAPAPRHYASNFLIPSAAAATELPAQAPGRWAIQVGAFASADQARRAADAVRPLAPVELAAARTALGTAEPTPGRILYRARLAGLSARTASSACERLQGHAHVCLIVPPGG